MRGVLSGKGSSRGGISGVSGASGVSGYGYQVIRGELSSESVRGWEGSAPGKKAPMVLTGPSPCENTFRSMYQSNVPVQGRGGEWGGEGGERGKEVRGGRR